MSKNNIPSVLVAGIAGRMGTIICKMLLDSDDFEFTGGLEHPGSDCVGLTAGEVVDGVDSTAEIYGDPERAFENTDVLIDFTRPEATVSFLEPAVDSTTALVIGTTGLNPGQNERVQTAADKIPIVKAANMSVGINLLLNLVRTTTKCLGEDFDVEIMEMHHRFKEDAPSGTARMLGEAIAETRDQQFDEVKQSGREGFVGERSREEINVSALRGGDVVGDHKIIFAGMGERIELTHRASSRETFATGALRAAEFVVKKESGLYDMQDVLELD